jgi:hypothetical protein
MLAAQISSGPSRRKAVRMLTGGLVNDPDLLVLDELAGRLYTPTPP